MAILCAVVPTDEIHNVWLFEFKLIAGTLAVIASAWLVYRRTTMPSATAVSYTHLDVYKRQVLELIVARIGTDYTSSRFLECYREFMRGLDWTAESSMDDLATRYQSACRTYFLPFVQTHQHFFENFVVNYIFRTYFPWRRRKPGPVPAIDSGRAAMTDAFLLLAVHYAIIRAVMIGMARCV